MDALILAEHVFEQISLWPKKFPRLNKGKTVPANSKSFGSNSNLLSKIRHDNDKASYCHIRSLLNISTVILPI